MEPPMEPPPLASPSPANHPEFPFIIQREEVSDVLLAAFAALGYAVSARALLFLALIGAFCLAVMAMLSQTVMAAVLLGLFCTLTVAPLVYLELHAKR
jgi:hypothetical protein